MNTDTLWIIVILFSAISLACGKSDETATAKQNEPVSLAELSELTNEGDKKNDPASPEQVSENKKIWYEDWNEGMESAKKEQKPVIVDFTAEWCVWCKKMEDETFADPGIKKRLENEWISVRIDVEARNKSGTIYSNESKRETLVYLKTDEDEFETKQLSNYQLLRFFSGAGNLPTFLFIDKDGKPLEKISSYIPKEELGLILDYFKEEVYKKDITFEEYKMSKS